MIVSAPNHVAKRVAVDNPIPSRLLANKKSVELCTLFALHKPTAIVKSK